MVKAQVVIGCGQLTLEEKKIGTAVVDYFKKRGFEPYFAEEVHSPLGLTQNVYANLKNSEYFVCINPKREHSDVGSLFVQQELAIASFLELPLVAFHQSSVGLQGVAKYLLVNSIEFSTVAEILEHYRENRPLSHWYHIQVENLSAVFRAKNCYVYIESIDDLRTGKQVFGKDEYKNELIWAGTGHTSVDIQRQAKGVIDAIFTVHGSGNWSMNEENTSTLYRYPSGQSV